MRQSAGQIHETGKRENHQPNRRALRFQHADERDIHRQQMRRDARQPIMHVEIDQQRHGKQHPGAGTGNI